MDDILTLLLVVGLLTVTTIGLVAVVMMRTSTTQTMNGQWVAYATNASLNGTNNTFQIGKIKMHIEAITAVDDFYNPNGDRGIIGVKLTIENNNTQTLEIALGKAFFKNKYGKRVEAEIRQLTGTAKTPKIVKVLPKEKYVISLVAKNSEKQVVINGTNVNLVTLLAKEGETAYFSLPLILNGKEILYTFKMRFIFK